MEQEQPILYNEGPPKPKNKLKEVLTIILMIALVVGLGMLAINQTIGFFYKARLLQSPCSLCKELNPLAGTSMNIIPYNISITNLT